jgi:hypothetical protein
MPGLFLSFVSLFSLLRVPLCGLRVSAVRSLPQVPLRSPRLVAKTNLAAAMKSLPVVLWMIAGFACGETLRICEVRQEAGAKTERMTLRYRVNGEPREEVIFVVREPVIGDADVAQAWAGPGTAISIKLTENGAKAMAEATGDMLPGRDRLAVIVDGVLVNAPRVMSPLGSNFQIDGLDDLDERGLENLARRMSGRPPLDPKEAAPQIPPPPHVKTVPFTKDKMVPFTEEEYQAIKAAREKAGIYHLENLPAEKELDAKLRKGMGRDEVVALFGRPSSTAGEPGNGEFRLSYEVAPEKREENPERKMLPGGFDVRFSNGKVSGWGHSSYSTASRERKVGGRVPGLLVAKIPEVDFSSGEVDMVALLEGVKIPDIRQDVNATDLYGLLSLATMAFHAEADEGEKDSISVGCDLMKILVLHFPEAKEVAGSAVDGKVRLRDLGNALSPYLTEGRPLPDLKAVTPISGR